MAKITPKDLEKLLKEEGGEDAHDFRASILTGTKEAKTHAEARLLSQYDEAVVDGDVKTVQELLDGGADANAIIFGEPVLNKALRYYRSEVAELLLKAGANPNRKYEGFPLLNQAVGSPRLLKAMLDAGAKIDATSTWGGPLAAAAWQGMAQSVELLLKAGAKVDAPCVMNRPPRDEVHGCTALFAAAMVGDAKIVKILLDAGANARAKNAKGETALDWARLRKGKKQEKVAAILEAAGAQAGAPVDLVVPQDLDFSKRCKTPQYQEALELLKQLTGKKPEPLDFENIETDARGGHGVLMGREEAKALVLKERERFAKNGCMLFFSRDLLKKNGDCVAILPTSDLSEVLAAVETTGANSGVYTEDVVKWFRSLQKEQSFEAHGIGVDFVEGRLSEAPKDATRLAQRMIKFCPDLIGDDAKKTVKQLADQLRKSGRISFWWD